MNVFDLHCDTISECLKTGNPLYENDQQLDLKRGLAFRRWVQTFAFWIDDRYRREAAWDNFTEQYRLFQREYQKNQDCMSMYSNSDKVCPGKCNVLLSVEGGAVLAGDLNRVGRLKQMGISMLTLTWNGANEIGAGALAKGGVTPFGREVVSEMERQNIIIDVSHLNEQGFWEAAEISTKPFIATHSNARSVQDHPRNLTDQQIRCIIKRGGLIGINFFPMFVNGQQDCTLEELFRHIDHILSLGGERVLSLGSDFDGASMPTEISGIKKLDKLYESMLKYFHKEITDSIFYQNASAFFDQNLTV